MAKRERRMPRLNVNLSHAITFELPGGGYQVVRRDFSTGQLEQLYIWGQLLEVGEPIPLIHTTLPWLVDGFISHDFRASDDGAVLMLTTDGRSMRSVFWRKKLKKRGLDEQTPLVSLTCLPPLCHLGSQVRAANDRIDVGVRIPFGPEHIISFDLHYRGTVGKTGEIVHLGEDAVTAWTQLNRLGL